MKRILTGLFLMLLLFSGCENSEIIQLNLKGTLKGKVYTRNEFGLYVRDNENILIQLEGSETLISSITESTGKYEMQDIPSGTYNLIISKYGYGEYQIQGIQIVGGNEPLHLSFAIMEKSSITIENLSLEIVNGSDIYMKGIVNHNNSMNPGDLGMPEIRYFISNTDNPSDTNYLQIGTIIFDGDSGTLLESYVYIDKDHFPSGSKIYIIAYGCFGLGQRYYDILSNEYKDSSLGKESDIASITIP